DEVGDAVAVGVRLLAVALAGVDGAIAVLVFLAVDEPVVVAVGVGEVRDAVAVGVDGALQGVGDAVAVGVEVAIVGRAVAVGVDGAVAAVGDAVAVGVGVEGVGDAVAV